MLSSGYSQNCNQPVISNVSSVTPTEVSIIWLDFNSSPEGFELELSEKGDPFQGIPTTNLISSNVYTYSNLNPGTSYQVFIRAICSESDTSNWNGPIFFNTDLVNGDDCTLAIAFSDNNCPAEDEYSIVVSDQENTVLGKDVFLSDVSMIIDHNWPPDLHISLESPDGTTIVLSDHSGLYARDFGNPENPSCVFTTAFSDLACTSLQEIGGTLIGTFQPDEPLQAFHNQQNPNGLWKLKVCDRADGDIGILKYLKLNFTTINCKVPTIVSLDSVTSKSMRFQWEQKECERIRFNYGPKGFDPQTGTLEFVDCDSSHYTLLNLLPDTEYDVYINAECNLSNSPSTCPFPVKTLCGDPTITSSFDKLVPCDKACLVDCPFDEFWTNAQNDDVDWKIHSGPTPTQFTGPSDAIHNIGHYLYLENQTEICNVNARAVLQSKCIRVDAMDSSCDLIFWYHMFGDAVNSLSLEIFTETAQDWLTIWEVNGSISKVWQQQQFSLDPYDGQFIKLRFVGLTGSNNFADIALDQISIIGGQTFGDGILYYRDADGDGYGDSEQPQRLCSDQIPFSFVDRGGDCNDSNASINPGMQEIRCNLIDENCNGDEDDLTDTMIDYTILSNIDESCRGAHDGQIEIIATGGTSPYTYLWSNGHNQSSLLDIGQGVYYCIITDSFGCKEVTDNIIIHSENNIIYAIQTMIEPDCKGVSNGEISILAGGGKPPYKYFWSNGQEGNQIDQITDGTYHVTIEDLNGCITSDSIVLHANNNIQIGITNLRHIQCHGMENGFINVDATNGQPPYTYAWSTGQSESFISGLAKGLFDVTITDDEGCFSTIENIVIEEPDPLDIIINNQENIICFGETEGIIQISAIGGTPPYSFIWNSGQTQDDINNLGAGEYQVTVSDINGCQMIAEPILIMEPSNLIIEIDSILNVECIGSEEGEIQLSVSGGTGNYQYFWNHDQNIMGAKASGLSAGNYSVTVVDNFGCKKRVQSIEVLANQLPIEVNHTILEPLACFNDSNAIVSFTINEGNPPYELNWSFGLKEELTVNTHQKSNLPAGNYTTTITDSNGCIGYSNPIVINGPDEIEIVFIDKTDNECFGDSLGSIELVLNGGVGEYRYEWSNGSFSPSIEFLPNGSYFVTIQDDNNCSITSQPIEIKSPDVISIQSVIEPQIGSDLGSVEIYAEGGVSPYKIKWENNASFSSQFLFESLSTGAYTAIIQDDNLCQLDTFFIVPFVNNNTDNLSFSISILPNPFESELQIISSDENIKSVIIYDAHGAIIRSINNSAFTNEVKMKLEALPSGLYFVSIQSKDHEAPILRKILKL